MPDEPSNSPNRKPDQPRKAHAGEILWTLRKAGSVRQAQLFENGPAKVELQVFAEGEMIYGRRFNARPAALLMAHEERRRYAGNGWVE